MSGKFGAIETGLECELGYCIKINVAVMGTHQQNVYEFPGDEGVSPYADI
jgi:hypothetical protein